MTPPSAPAITASHPLVKSDEWLRRAIPGTQDLSSFTEEIRPSRGEFFGNTVIAVTYAGGGYPRDYQEKYYWPISGGKQPSAGAPQEVLRFEAEPEYLGMPGDAILTTQDSLDITPDPEPDPSTWRGVFSLPVKHQVLFTQEVEIRISTLPEWKPHITIDTRTFELEDE